MEPIFEETFAEAWDAVPEARTAAIRMLPLTLADTQIGKMFLDAFYD